MLAQFARLVGEIFPSVSPETGLGEALEKFSQHDGERLPVVTQDGQLIGSIAKTDVLLTIAHGPKKEDEKRKKEPDTVAVK